MTGITYIDVFSIEFDCDPNEAAGPGDLVHTGSNHFPHFRVVAVHEDMAWLRDVQSGLDHLVPLRRCHRLDAPMLAIAAE